MNGGSGYSGGGCGNGGNGGMDGGDGESGNSKNCTGGMGSGFDIASIQNLFEHYKLLAAKGSKGHSSYTSNGGGGGGVQIQTTNSKEGMGRVNGASYSYGQGGDGYLGDASRGNRGVVLLEIKNSKEKITVNINRKTTTI
ncbi:uncharacterized protein LOC142358162 [Convolutriloba macropyga]|uniref:uncharacterized protein LOC142358162 n=1 Tax=Convolutriloba macropyga TaxID=536237 RepID=UPI003F525907